MKYIIIAVLLIFMFVSIGKKESSIKTLNPQDKILAFGDSITYGYGASSDESYPSVLSSLTGHKVINAGVNGETSQEGLVRLPKLLEDDSIKLILLCFGGNDILQRKSMSKLKNNLKMMVQMAEKKNIAIILISVPNIGLFGLSSLKLYEEVANEEDIFIINGMLAEILSDPSLKSDQIHPNALGYEAIAKKIYEKIKEGGFL